MAGFDTAGLFAALDARRQELGLSWKGLADDIWDLSAGLNARRDDHPIAPATLRWTDDRGGVSCQHALFMLRWLGKSPEDFYDGAEPVEMPDPGPDYRLRWNIPRLAACVDEARRRRGLTWPEAAELAHCTASQLSGLKYVRFGVNIRLTMRLVRGLRRPSTDFIEAVQW